MADKILIFGKGYIGTRLQEELNAEATDRKIYTLKDAEEEIQRFKPGIIINCIGFIGRNVDDCELNKDKAMQSNVFAPIILGEAAFRSQARFIHISSGCIYHYDYDKGVPIEENQEPDFFDLYYSRTKIYSEAVLNSLARKTPILTARVRVPLDDRPNTRNILDKLISYKKVIDLPNSVTYIPDFLKALKYLIKIEATGIYNLVNKNPLYYPDLMEVYRKHVSEFKYEVINFKKLNMVRTNLVLSVKKLESTGFKVRDIKEVLEECVKNYLKY